MIDRQATHLTTRIVASAATVALAVALTACADDAPASEDLVTTSPVPVGNQPTPGDTSEPDDRTFASPQECLIGTWLMDNDSWLESVGQFVAEADTAFTSLNGPVYLDLNADGSYTSTYESWTITMSVNGGTGSIVRDGQDSGSWSATDDRVQIVEESTDSTVTSTFIVDGETITFQSDGSVGAVDDFDYECSVASLVVTTEEGTFSFTWAG